jgi:hypothetical protein
VEIASVVEKGRKIAAAMMEVAEADVEFARQRFLVKGTDRSIGLFEAAAAAVGNGLPSDLREPLVGICDQVMSIPSFAYTFGACEVEVDPETGGATSWSHRVDKNGSPPTTSAPVCDWTREVKAASISLSVPAFRTCSCTPFARAASCASTMLRGVF